MYPDVFLKFARARQRYGDVERAADAGSSSTAWRRGEEITVDLEPGKTLIVKFLTIGEPHPDGTRTVFFELNGQPREVTVRDQVAEGRRQRERAKADPAQPGHVGAPIPGAVTSDRGASWASTVKKGDRLLVMEAMKMQTHGVRAGRRQGEADAGAAGAARWRRRICCW